LRRAPAIESSGQRQKIGIAGLRNRFFKPQCAVPGGQPAAALRAQTAHGRKLAAVLVRIGDGEK
jgi:hypothetical protein